MPRVNRLFTTRWNKTISCGPDLLSKQPHLRCSTAPVSGERFPDEAILDHYGSFVLGVFGCGSALPLPDAGVARCTHGAVAGRTGPIQLYAGRRFTVH